MRFIANDVDVLVPKAAAFFINPDVEAADEHNSSRCFTNLGLSSLSEMPSISTTSIF